MSNGHEFSASPLLGSVLLCTFRAQARAAAAWGLSLGSLVVLLVVLHWLEEFPTDESRQRLGEQVESGALGFAQVFFGKPHQVETFGGFASWYGLGLMPLLIGLYMILAATAIARGAEERGETELLLTLPRSRARVFGEQVGGLVLVLAAVSVCVWAGLEISGPIAGEPLLPPARAALATLNVALAAALFAALGLLLSQLSQSRRTAASLAGVALIASQLWANIGLVARPIEDGRWLSPLYLYALSSPLSSDGVSMGAMALMFLMASSFGFLAGYLFVRRDFGSSVHVAVPMRQTWAQRFKTTEVWFLGGVFERSLRGSLGTSVLWAGGLSLFGVLFTVVTPSIREAFADQPGVRDLLQSMGFGDSSSDAVILSIYLFAWLPALAGLFGVVVASGFASELQTGRLELELTSPVSRQWLFLSHAVAAMLAIAITVVLTGLAFLIATWMSGLEVNLGRAMMSFLLLVLPAWVLLSCGYALAGWRPSSVGIASAVLFCSFFFDILAEPLNLPDAIRKLSVFELYGRPLLEGVHWLEAGVLAGLVLFFLAAGSMAFTRQDISR